MLPTQSTIHSPLSNVGLFVACSGLVGFILGSFINMAAWRIPRGLSIVAPRSRCIHCDRELGALDLIPVFSYLFLGGRCRTCRQPIPIRYLLAELFCGGLWALTWWTAPSLQTAIINALFASTLLLATVIDLEHQRIPDSVSLTGLILALVNWSTSGFAWSSVALAVGVFAFTYLLASFGFGGGDIKLATVIALFMGWPYGLLALILSFVVGGVAGVMLLVLNIKSRKDAIPFGPFLSLGAWLVIVWGERMLTWYLGYLGW